MYNFECITFELEQNAFMEVFLFFFHRATKMVAVSSQLLVLPHRECFISILTMKGCILLLFIWVYKEVYTDGACYKICPLRSSSRRCLRQVACKAEGQA